MDDSISRKTVINGLDYIITELDKLIEEDPFNSEYHHTKKQVKEIKNGVQNLPPTQPECKKGKWINDGDCYVCSECRSVYEWWADSQVSNYCPNCGADMRDLK